MAERRMFAKTIIDSDAFLDMPLTAQALYFHLCMRADDDGFVNNPKKIQRMVGCGDDDSKLLLLKSFVIPFDSGVCVIRHWRLHNYIRNDRYKPTVYQEEKSALALQENGIYREASGLGIPDGNQRVYQMEPQVRVGKDRVELEKERDKVPGEGTPPEVAAAEAFPYEEYRKVFCQCCPSLPAPQETSQWTAARKKALRSKRVSLEEFRDVCKKIERSDFLTGRSGKWAGCSLDWVLKPANWQKIVEGNYGNRKGTNTSYDIDELEKASFFEPPENL